MSAAPDTLHSVPTRRSSDLNFGEIDADIRSIDAPARGVSRIVSDLRAVDHCFGGRAADVDARATEMLFLDERHRPDRKSTRLNSSHITTSYAVFCLKKKRYL